MYLPSRHLDEPRRHDLVFLNRQGWCSLLASRGDLSADPFVNLWSDQGWPLIARRRSQHDAAGMPLGLPLPPWAGKRRIALTVPSKDVFAVAEPPSLSTVGAVAPRAWQPTLDSVERFASRCSVDVRVFGSLSWRALTGLGYLTPSSDIDLLFHVRPDTDVDWLTAGLAEIEALAPMRLDGELVRRDGAAVNWREWHGNPAELLMKTIERVELVEASNFLPEPVWLS